MNRRKSSSRNSFRSAVLGGRMKSNTSKRKLARTETLRHMEMASAKAASTSYNATTALPIPLVPLERRYPDVDGDAAEIAAATAAAARAAAANAAAKNAAVKAAKVAAGNDERALHHGGQFEKVYPALRGPHERCTRTRRPIYGVRLFGTYEAVRTPPMYAHHQGFRRNYSPGAHAVRPDTWLMRVREATTALRPTPSPRVVRHISTSDTYTQELQPNSVEMEIDIFNEHENEVNIPSDPYSVQTRLDLLREAPAVEYVPAHPIPTHTPMDTDIMEVENLSPAPMPVGAPVFMQNNTEKQTPIARKRARELRPLRSIGNVLNLHQNANAQSNQKMKSNSSSKQYGVENSAPPTSHLAYVN